MTVTLLHYTPLWVCAKAIRKCWASEDKSDTFMEEYRCTLINDSVEDGGEYIDDMFLTEHITGQEDKALIDRIGNKNKHSSTLEHLNYSFDIDGISRACLQELARHRHASLSVKSSRYTLKELKDAVKDGTVDYRDFLHQTNNSRVDMSGLTALGLLKDNLESGISNDIAKYSLPEAYKTSLVWTINARSLQNFLSLRTDKAALLEIRNLANTLYDTLPSDHKYLFNHTISGSEEWNAYRKEEAAKLLKGTW